MAFSVDVVNISGRDVSLSVDGEHQVVKDGAVLRATPEAAGQPPRWRPADDDDRAALAANPGWVHTRTVGDTLEVFDLGSGLLAQVGNWAPAGHEDDEPADPLQPGDSPAADTTTGTEPV